MANKDAYATLNQPTLSDFMNVLKHKIELPTCFDDDFTLLIATVSSLSCVAFFFSLIRFEEPVVFELLFFVAVTRSACTPLPIRFAPTAAPLP